ncbi:hypothetical protein CPB84DRAFT_1749672 [Gymnopilus junonius]|uniref:Uncharacterized protein n=1 Tax=Gymnopilus junonius TaxID=109634 RepID=A0A9P5NIW2_GYMJU|nr:hypothetical protein CPB84DRAFT_1749672 [Gymnopilus junonius]
MTARFIPIFLSMSSTSIGEVNTSSQLPQRSEDIISLPVLEFQQLIDNTRKKLARLEKRLMILRSLAEKLAMLEQKLDKEWAKQLKEIQAAMIEKRAEIEESEEILDKAHEMTDAYYEQCNKLKKHLKSLHDKQSVQFAARIREVILSG